MIAKRPNDYQAFRISPNDSNRLVLVFDPTADATNFVFAIEIFDVGGRTPPNDHKIGHEMFYVLQGQGAALSKGKRTELNPGDSLYLSPGTPHEIENTGPTKLYCLTFMAPDDSFSSLIRGGEQAVLDEEDLEVIRGLYVRKVEQRENS